MDSYVKRFFISTRKRCLLKNKDTWIESGGRDCNGDGGDSSGEGGGGGEGGSGGGMSSWRIVVSSTSFDKY